MARHLICISLLLALALTGCPSTAKRPTNSAARHAGEHGHANVGPHGGELIELGSEAYHAELVYPEHGSDDAAVTIYFLDGTAEKRVAVDAPEVRLIIRYDGRGEQFAISAAPEAGDAEGTSSRFMSSNEELLALFGEEEVEGELVVTIGGKQYRGEIEHHHHEDHGDHEHAH